MIHRGVLHKKHRVGGDYAACGSMIRRGGSVQRASAFGDHFFILREPY